MKLDVGYYKVLPRGREFDSPQYLRVTMKGRDKYFQFNHALPYKVDEDQETLELSNYKILKKISKPIEYRSTKINVSFTDQDGDEIELTTRTIKGLKDIFIQFPRLKKCFEFLG